jgi:hypothetical protein
MHHPLVVLVAGAHDHMLTRVKWLIMRCQVAPLNFGISPVGLDAYIMFFGLWSLLSVHAP